MKSLPVWFQVRVGHKRNVRFKSKIEAATSAPWGLVWAAKRCCSYTQSPLCWLMLSAWGVASPAGLSDPVRSLPSAFPSLGPGLYTSPWQRVPGPIGNANHPGWRWWGTDSLLGLALPHLTSSTSFWLTSDNLRPTTDAEDRHPQTPSPLPYFISLMAVLLRQPNLNWYKSNGAS